MRSFLGSWRWGPALVLLILLMLVGLLPGVAFAQNPCTDGTAPAIAIAPTKITATLPDQTKIGLDGVPVVASYDLGVFGQGVPATGSPISMLSIPRASFTSVGVATAPDCYQLTTLPTEILGVPKGTAFAVGLRTKAPDGFATAWVLSNPFGFPAALGLPGAVRVLR